MGFPSTGTKRKTPSTRSPTATKPSTRRPTPSSRPPTTRWGGDVSVLDLLASPMAQRSILVAVLVGLVAPVVGTFLVQRRLSLLGDGIGHVALTGVGAGWLVGTLKIGRASCRDWRRVSVGYVCLH